MLLKIKQPLHCALISNWSFELLKLNALKYFFDKTSFLGGVNWKYGRRVWHSEIRNWMKLLMLTGWSYLIFYLFMCLDSKKIKIVNMDNIWYRPLPSAFEETREKPLTICNINYNHHHLLCRSLVYSFDQMSVPLLKYICKLMQSFYLPNIFRIPKNVT